MVCEYKESQLTYVPMLFILFPRKSKSTDLHIDLWKA